MAAAQFPTCLVLLPIWMVWVVCLAEPSGNLKSTATLNSKCTNITIIGPEIKTQLKKIRDCAVIEGHLRLFECQLPKSASLPNLIQVTDYIQIDRVQGLTSLSKFLPCLSVIRGERLLYDRFGMALLANTDLREIGPWSLKVIKKGGVYVKDNILFCADEKIHLKNLILEKKYQDESIFINNHHFCPFVTCEEEGYCKARPKLCPRKFVYKNCHKECLGGCTMANSASACTACRHFLVVKDQNGSGECAEACPEDTLIYLGYLCITYETCQQKGWVVFDPEDAMSSPPEKMGVKGYKKRNNKECIKDCPGMFNKVLVNKDGININSTARCERKTVCSTTVLTNEYLGDNLRFCTRIDGNLTITVSGGKDVMKQLEANLGKIESVSDYVMVVGANTLYSLSFLSNLRIIEGKKKVYHSSSPEGYAFYVFENPNLQELWDWNSRSRNLTINGRGYIYMNDNLCLHETDKLEEVGINISKWDICNVTNGRKNQCKLYKTILKAAPGSSPNTIQLRWRHVYCGGNPGYLAGYTIFFSKTDRNISRFRGRDYCSEKRSHNNVWTRKLMKMPEPIEKACLEYTLEDLEPNTMYAIYVRSLPVDDIRESIESELVYVTTYKALPEKPQKKKFSLGENGINISWETSRNTASGPSSGDLLYKVVIHIEDIIPDATDSSNQTYDAAAIKNKCIPRADVEERETEKLAKKNAAETNSTSKDETLCSCEDTVEQNRKKRLIDIENKINEEYLDGRGQQSQTSITTSHQTTSKSNSNSHQIVRRNAHNDIHSDAKDRACERNKALPSDCSNPYVNWTNSTLKFDSLADSAEWHRRENGIGFTYTKLINETTDVIEWPEHYGKRAQPFQVVVKIRACFSEPLLSCPHPNVPSPCYLCSEYLDLMGCYVKSKSMSKFVAKALLNVSEEDKKANAAFHCTHPLGKRRKPGTAPICPTEISEKFQNGNEATLSGSFKNSSEKKILISWNVDENIEPIIYDYIISYQRIDTPETYWEQICTPRIGTKFRARNITISTRRAGKYWIGMQIRTSNNGTIATGEACVLIPPIQNNTVWAVLVACGGIVVIVVAILGYFVWLKNKEPTFFKITENDAYGGVIKGFMDDIEEKLIVTTNELHVGNERLGGGEFGEVYKGTLTKQNEETKTVAIKTFKEKKDVSRNEGIQNLHHEAIILQQLDSHFTVKLLGVMYGYLPTEPQKECFVYLAFEYMGGKDLLSIVRSNRGHFTVKDKTEIGLQITDGMEYLHAKNFLHRDLAARNIMVAFENSRLIAKIGDFGFACELKEGSYYFPKNRTQMIICWAAPESLKDHKYDYKSDVWSFGVLLFELITDGTIPYLGKTNKEVINQVPDGTLRLRNFLPTDASKFLSSVMISCLSIKQKDRPTFSHLKQNLFDELKKTPSDFLEWYTELSYCRNRSNCVSGSTEAFDEGCDPGSSLDLSQDGSDHSTAPIDDTETDDGIACSIPNEYMKDRSSCLSLNCCADSRLTFTKRRFAASDGVLFFS